MIVSFALLMSSLDSTIVATALHTLQTDLDTSVSWAGWTITSYSLGLVVMLPLAGRLSDRYGRRRIFVGSVVVFGAASLACGLVDSIYVLVIMRAVQAIGGAGFTPSATGIVVEHFGRARDKAVGLFGSIFPIGATIGPILGGLLVTSVTWRGVFLVNVPIAAALVPLALRIIPPDRPRRPAAAPRWDVAGIALLAIGLLSLMGALTYLGDAAGAALWWVAAPAAIAVIALAALIHHVRRARDPIIAPRLIYGRGFGAVNVVTIVYGGAVSGMVALIPFYAVTRYGIGVLGSGTLLVSQSIAAIVVSGAAVAALRHTGYRIPLYAGGVLIAVGAAGLALHPMGLGPYGWLAVCAFLIGLGLGGSSPASRNACLQLIPEQSASLAALRSTGRQVGQIAAISVATAVIGLSADPAAAQAAVYATFAAVLLAALPVIHRIPEHRGAW